MPSPRKKKLTVKVALTPSRSRSARIKANEVKKEEVDDEKPTTSRRNLQKKTNSPRGKGGLSTRDKSKKSAKGKGSNQSSKMTVLALAAARKRKLNGEDDDEDEDEKPKRAKRKKVVKKTGRKKAVQKKTTSNYLDPIDENNEEGLEEDALEEQQMLAAVKEENELSALGSSGVGDEEDEEDDDLDEGDQDVEDGEDEAETLAEDDDEDDDDDDDEVAEDEQNQGIFISDEHQYIETMNHEHTEASHHEVIEESEIEVPQEQVQAELQEQQEQEDDEDENDDDEDIDENLFFGIPEQRSPELATCTHCKGKFRKEDVHEHMLTCPERYVQCRECGKILSNLQTLERHHKRFHLKIREVPCTLCDKMFIDEAAARKHLKTVHFKVKNFHCPHCDKSFSQRNKLTYHVRTHSGEKPYSCAECGRSFSLLWNLKTHLRTHTGEKPYACEICGRRFTQKQNMTSHLTTHRKPKPDKSFRAHFSSEIEEYDNNAAGIISGGDFTNKTATAAKNFRAFEQAKQLNAQTIGSNHYVLGDMQNIEVHTASETGGDQNVNLEHGLGLLSSVARKGDSTDVQVDGIVNIPESQFQSAASSGNMDQVVEVLIRNNSNEDKTSNVGSTLSVQMPSGNSQNKIILDPSTQAVTDADGQEIPLDTNTAANLANILQNPDVLAAINNAASTNKLIVIGPVSMFDGSTSQSSSVVALSAADNSADSSVTTTFSQEQLAQISAMVQQEQTAAAAASSQVSSQTVNDSISATSALAAVESFLQNEQQPTSSLSAAKNDEIVNNILGSIQPDGKRGPSAVVQSARGSSNLTISMPPMSQSSMTISQSNLGIKTNKLPIMKTLSMQSTSSEEVSSSVDEVQQQQPANEEISANPEVQQSSMEENQHMVLQQGSEVAEQEQGEQVESTTQSAEEYMVSANSGLAEGQFISTDPATGVADSSDMVDTEASSSGEPVLLLSTDEHGQPQIIVKMPDGTETIMSDPALAESLIQVPTITNAVIEGSNNEAEATQMSDQIPATIHLQIPDQGVPGQIEVPSQSGMQAQFVTQSDQVHEEMHQLPDQSLAPVSSVDTESSVDSSQAINMIESQNTQQSLVSNSSERSIVQTPDSSSQSYSQTLGEQKIDSRQGVFVMEHVSASDERSNYPEQSNIDFPDQAASSDFAVDSSSNNQNVQKVDGGNVVVESSFLQMNDVSQSTSINNMNIAASEAGNVSSTDNSSQ
ncbi:uncharacterized protein [Clytia hemisphaerica]|uniref:C2H2-type domain-containing protein n=1 Tax=Clytia hemisphaerica TaxID=252671 RepID=A0A7M5WYE3_9CNID